MLVEGLQAYLSADTGVQSALGTPATRADQTTGIYPVMAAGTPDTPYLVYSQVGGEPQTVSMQGTNRLQNDRWRFSCHGATYKEAKALARAVNLAMISLFGTLPAPGGGKAAQCQGSWKRSEVDTAEPLTHGTLFSTHVDFEILYQDYDT